MIPEKGQQVPLWPEKGKQVPLRPEKGQQVPLGPEKGQQVPLRSIKGHQIVTTTEKGHSFQRTSRNSQRNIIHRDLHEQQSFLRLCSCVITQSISTCPTFSEYFLNFCYSLSDF